MEQATSRDGQRSNTRLVQESPTLSCRAHQSIGVISQREFADYILEPETANLFFLFHMLRKLSTIIQKFRSIVFALLNSCL